METFSALLTICAGNSPVTGEFLAQRPLTRSFDVFFYLRQNKRLSKQWWSWWFETPSRPLQRHCNVWEKYGILFYDIKDIHKPFLIWLFVTHTHWPWPWHAKGILSENRKDLQHIFQVICIFFILCSTTHMCIVIVNVGQLYPTCIDREMKDIFLSFILSIKASNSLAGLMCK